ncbi:MAG TPA: SUF system Fe-S cluster assembly protein [Haliangium sp.]|nr:SUF system Fe-S cluster assembly protein [Haliangium sp.]
MSSENDVPANQPIRLPIAPPAPEWERTEIAEREAVAVAGSGEKPAQPIDVEAVRPLVVDAIKTVYDPEIPVNIYELGLIYALDIDPEGQAEIKMTLTAPACPVAGVLPQEVADKVASVAGISRARVELVWDPPWSMERMSEEAKLELGFF